MKTFIAIPLPVQGYTLYPVIRSGSAFRSFSARASAFRRHFPRHALSALLVNMAGEVLASR
jgi:hypothetical protein